MLRKRYFWILVMAVVAGGWSRYFTPDNQAFVDATEKTSPYLLVLVVPFWLTFVLLHISAEASPKKWLRGLLGAYLFVVAILSVVPTLASLGGFSARGSISTSSDLLGLNTLLLILLSISRVIPRRENDDSKTPHVI